MNINMSNGRVEIDGKTFTGSNVVIKNGRVIIDGKVQDGELIGDVNVIVHGDIDSLENTCGKIVANNVGKIKTTSGDVNCENVDGSITTVSGDVECGSVSGNIKTVSGDVSHR